jgi:hypothetical protein
MSTVTKETLKTYFQTGDIPTEAQYVDLIDSTCLQADLDLEKQDRVNKLAEETTARKAEDDAIDAKIGDTTNATVASNYPAANTVYDVLDGLIDMDQSISTRVSAAESWIAASKVAELESFIFGCSAEIGDIGVGDVFTFRMPYAFTLVDIRASLNTAPTSATTTFKIKVDGTDVSNAISISSGTTTGTATNALLGENSPPLSIAMDAEVKVNVSAAGPGAGTGLKVSLVGYRGDCSVTGTAAPITIPLTFPISFSQYSITCT